MQPASRWPARRIAAIAHTWTSDAPPRATGRPALDIKIAIPTPMRSGIQLAPALAWRAAIG